MEQLQLREKEIFETLKSIRKYEFVIIGGYAVNAYTFPRFSVDCDIVVKSHEESKTISAELIKLGYKKIINLSETFYSKNFERYEKEIKTNFKVSIDILIKEILDRQTGVIFQSEWIFKNSKLINLKGKTISEQLKLRIINPEALFVMKFISCRATDIRDIFLLISQIKDKKWVKGEISVRYDFQNRLSKIIKEINSKEFKNGLQGVFGYIEEGIFEKYRKLIINLGKNNH